MTNKKQKYNQTYCIGIIDSSRIVTLNRYYVPTFQQDKISGQWSDEYVSELNRCSVEIGREAANDLINKFEEIGLYNRVENEGGQVFRFFYLYSDSSSTAQKSAIRKKVAGLLELLTNHSLEFYE